MDVAAEHIGSLNPRGDADESHILRQHRQLLGLEQVRLPEAQRNSLEFLAKVIHPVIGDQLLSKFMANVMYEVLEDLKPRKVATRSGEIKVLLLPTAGAEQEKPMNLCGIKSVKQGIEIRDIKVPTLGSYDGLSSSYSIWVKKFAQGLRDAFPKADFATMCGELKLRPDLDLHSLYDRQVMRNMFWREFSSRLDWNATWARDHGIRLPGVEQLRQSTDRSECFEIVMKIANSQVRRCLESLLRALPPDIVNPLWNSKECYTADLTRACTAKTLESQVNRARWHATFPLYRNVAEQDTAISYIDKNEFTLKRLGSQIGVPGALVRRLREWPFSTLQQVQIPHSIDLTRVLSEVNINHIPQHNKCSQAEADAFTSVVAKTGKLVGIQKRVPSAIHATKNMLRNTRGKWSEVHAAATDDELEHAADFIGVFAERTLLAAFFRLQIVAQEVMGAPLDEEPGHYVPRRQLIAGQERLHIGRASRNDLLKQWSELSRSLLLAGLSETWSLSNIIQASKTWHKSVGYGSFRQGFRMWPALCDPVIAPNGIQLIPLTTSAELADEGQAMRHCVGGYSQVCLFRGSHIFSIRDKHGKRLSTLQLVQTGHSVRNEQNHGFANGIPDTRAAKAADWFVKKVNRGTIPVNWDDLIAKQQMVRMRSGIQEVLGFDPHDRTVWNKAFSEFKSPS
jgi:hypothetical protein